MKKLMVFALLAVLAMVLAACGRNEPEEAGPTIIRLAVQGDSTPGTRALLDAFNNSQDEFYAYWIEMTNDSAVMREQLMASLRAGSAEYDIVSLDVVWAGEFAAAGFIEPLDVYMQNSGLRIPQFNAGSMASGSYSVSYFPVIKRVVVPDFNAFAYRPRIFYDKSVYVPVISRDPESTHSCGRTFQQ